MLEREEPIDQNSELRSTSFISPDLPLPKATSQIGSFVNEQKAKIESSLDSLFNENTNYNENFQLRSEIQKNHGAKYLHGMLYICQCTADEKIRTSLKESVLKIWNDFDKLPFVTYKNVKALEHAFAVLLMKALQKHFHYIDLKAAHKQVTMAKDLAIFLTKIDPVKSKYHIKQKTGTDEKNLQVEEETKFLQISEKYYEKFLDFSEPEPQRGFSFTSKSLSKIWFESTLKHAGFDKKAKNTWIENFFKIYRECLQQTGVPASSSSRWYFNPSNLREHKITIDEVVEEKNSSSSTKKHVNQISVIAMGTVAAFDADKSIQDTLAFNQLEEVYRLQLDKKSEYEKLYGTLADKFYFNYQTLLSPVFVDAILDSVPSFIRKHKDNNTRFVEMGRKTIKKLAEKYKDDNVQFIFTNAAVNKLAPISTEYPEDKETRLSKVGSTGDLLLKVAEQFQRNFITREVSAKDIECKNAIVDFGYYLKSSFNSTEDRIEKYSVNRDEKHVRQLGQKAIASVRHLGLKKPLENEIMLRMRASFCLKRLLEHPDNYAELSGFTLSSNPKKYFMESDRYKRNILISALEILSLGSQATNVVGCKSARDRTAIVLCAVKAMMLHPTQMLNWKVINKSIINSLEQGHHFRAIQHHCGMVKIDDVHVDFLNQVSGKLQTIIKQTKKFSKALGSSFSLKQKLGIALFFSALITGIVLLFLFPPAGIASLLGAGYLGAQIGIGAAIAASILLTGFQTVKSFIFKIFNEKIKQAKSEVIGAIIGIGTALALTLTYGISIAFVGIAIGAGLFATKIASWLEHKLRPGIDPHEFKMPHDDSSLNSSFGSYSQSYGKDFLRGSTPTPDIEKSTSLESTLSVSPSNTSINSVMTADAEITSSGDAYVPTRGMRRSSSPE